MDDAPAVCPECGARLSPALLSCPGCLRLVHAETLKGLAAEAEAASAAGDRSAALGAWRRALELLPPGTRQRDAVAARVAELSREVDRAPAAKRPPPKWLAGLGAFGLLLWKLKAVAAFLLSQGKFLFVGLSKGGTFLTMVLSFGVYWTAWGWKFALGLVASIYVHEMGHVAAMRRFGIRATAPMFVPGLGAFIRMTQYPASPVEESRVGLAGPLWGLGAALAAYGAHAATAWPSLAAIARVGAWINLFNLLPVRPLDGGRGMASLSRGQRAVVAAAAGGLYFLTAEGLLLLVAILAAAQAFAAKPREPDRMGLLQFLLLLAALSAMCLLVVPPAA